MKLLLFCLFVITITSGNSQNTVDPETIIFTKTEQPVSFPGGDKQLLEFINRNLNSQVPIELDAPSGEHKVIIRFIVKTDSLAYDFTPQSRNGYGMEEEAIRMLKLIPAWKPARQNKRPVNAFQWITVYFSVPELNPGVKPDKSLTILPDNFKIGNYVEVFSKDSIRIYYSCTGTVEKKKDAEFMRVGKMDSEIINVSGEFTDYDRYDNPAFKATMLKNNLEGAAKYFYPNGQIKEEGNYQNNVRSGRWFFYYSNGKLKHVYDYTEKDILVFQAFAEDGTALVNNGTGTFETEFSKYLNCTGFRANGPVQNGRMHGRWTFRNVRAAMPIATEDFHNGRFVKGNSGNYEYKEQKIDLVNFYPNEHLVLTENSMSSPGESYFDLSYNSKTLNSSFYPELERKLNKHNFTLKNQWLVVGITIDKRSNLKAINIASSINDINLENYFYQLLLKFDNWTTLKVDGKMVECHLFFSVFVDNNKLYIPELYRYN